MASPVFPHSEAVRTLRRRTPHRCLAVLLFAALAVPLAAAPAIAQSQEPPAAAPAPYKPPLRGAPGGRVGGASRGAPAGVSLPTIELIAPADHTGLAASATPVFYFYISQAPRWPTQFTISQPLVAKPVVEVTIPTPTGPGLHAVRLADYGARLDPGVIYTWSVSVVLDPNDWSKNVVASATIERQASELPAAAAVADPRQRTALLAQAGLWYDAVAAAAAAANVDRHAALDGLMEQVGLTGPAAFDRQNLRLPR